MRKQQAPAAPSVTIDTIIDHVSRDKGIDREEVLIAMEQAIQKAGRSKYGPDHDIRATIDRRTGEIALKRCTTVVEEVEDPEREVTFELVKKAKLEADLGEELGFQVFYRDEDDKKAKKQDK